MKTLIVLIAAIGIGYVGWSLWQRAHERKHDPVEYFAGWDGYTLPIHLTTLITKDEAEAIAARGNATSGAASVNRWTCCACGWRS